MPFVPDLPRQKVHIGGSEAANVAAATELRVPLAPTALGCCHQSYPAAIAVDRQH